MQKPETGSLKSETQVSGFITPPCPPVSGFISQPSAASDLRSQVSSLSPLRRESVLSGEIEAAALPADLSRPPIPDFAFNELHRRGMLYKPVFDTGPKPQWPDNHPFAVCLTHDVDIVSEADCGQSLRKMRTVLTSQPPAPQKALQFGLATRRFAQAAVRFGGNDPLWQFEKWLDAERAVGARSTFFFFPDNVGRSHFTDCNYSFNQRIGVRGKKVTVADWMRELDRDGWEIGLHASWNAYADVAELRRQKQRVEETIGHEIVSVRHHWLHYDIRLTPVAQSAAGFTFDSTLGFNDNVGFRFGTCRPWQLTDLKTQQRLPVWEIPLIAQESALLNPLKGLRLDVERAYAYLLQLVDEVAAVGGVFTLSFHPDVVHPVRCPGWFDLYVRILAELKSRNAWFATIRQVGEFAKAHS